MLATPSVIKGYSASNGIPKPVNQGSIPRSVIGGAINRITPGMSSGMSAGPEVGGYQTPSYSYPSSPGPKAATYGYGPTPVPLSAQSASGGAATRGSIPQALPSVNNGWTKSYYGGTDYGTATPGQRATITSNMNKIKTDPGYVKSETDRALNVIAGLRSRGEDTSAQEKYLFNTLGYQPTVADPITADAAPPIDQPPVDQPPAPAAPPVDYKAMAEAEFAAKLAGLRSQSDQEIASLKSGWDGSNQTLKDQRVLDDLKFERNNSPFQGETGYAQGIIGRERTIQDSQSLNDYNAHVAAIQSGLANSQNDIQGQIAARAYELQSQAEARAMQESVPTGVYKGQPTVAAKTLAFNQGLETSKYNHTLTQDEVKNNQWSADFVYKQVRDGIKDKQYQQKFDLDVQTKGLDYALKQATLNQKISNDAVQNAISGMNANTSAMNAGTNAGSLNWAMDPNNPDNKYKNWQMDPNNPNNKKADPNQPKPTTYAEAYKDIDSSMYVTPNTDQFGKNIGGIKVTNPKGLGNYIFTLNLPQADTKKLYLRYGLKWGG